MKTPIHENNLPEHKCLKCQYHWIARVMKPKQCPSCKSYDWNTKQEVKQ